VLTGNPNCGKTTVFNALTGLRAKVGNYSGVTVERKEGRLLGAPKGRPVTVLDLPGTYSLTPQSLDEQIARDVLFHRLADVPPPDVVVVVVDAFNLQRNLYFATQVIELGYPTLVALNMIDVARENGHETDPALLSQRLGVPVLPIVASTGQGIPALRQKILSLAHALKEPAAPPRFCDLPKAFQTEVGWLAQLLEDTFPESHFQAEAEAGLLLTDERLLTLSDTHYPPAVRERVAAARRRLEGAGVDWRSAAIEARYARVAAIQREVTRETGAPGESTSDRLDRVFTHRVWGLLIFGVLMALMFQSIFTLARYPMDLIQQGVDALGAGIGRAMPPGALNDLLAKGVVRGVGAVVVFLPQICLLFLFIGLLEDTGYMARAAFLGDRIMRKVGLHGKSFIPMLSSFACAIPGIMATRTIESVKDRLVTILVAPLMSCSARLPVYALLIAACIPDVPVLGFLRLPGLTMMGMYLLGLVVALGMAWLFKKTLLKGPAPMLILELPPYKRPLVRTVLRHVWERAMIFLRQAGTVILGINILLWFLASYPQSPTVLKNFEDARVKIQAEMPPDLDAQMEALDREQASVLLQRSFAGRLGHGIEPLIAPLGFDWKIGIGIVASFAAREVFVSTMALVYDVGELADPGEDARGLAETLRAQKRADGTPVYTTLTGLTLMVFYVFALQCASTVAVVRRETNSWKWPVFQWLYMGLLAWGLAFITYRVGLLFGLG
jgi:ferrous iron transport protein B